MKNKLIKVIIIFLFLTGMGFVLYPVVTNYMYVQESKNTIENFKNVAENLQSNKYSELYASMQAYNEEIYNNGQYNLKDPFFYAVAAFDLREYGIEDNIVGYVNIPRMGVEIPIYLGATKDNMAVGVGNLGYTSIPIGGLNTNAVLAGHRGWIGTAMFRDIESLEIGDKIYITNFWQTLTYEVINTKVILPSDIDEVKIEEGKDLVTLLTCHPYTKNYQRYLVYAQRVIDDDVKLSLDTGMEFKYIFNLGKMSSSQRLIFMEKWLPIIVLSLIFFVLMIFFVKRQKSKRR